METTANNTNRFLISSFSLNEVVDLEVAVNSVGLCKKIILSQMARYSHLSGTRQVITHLANKLIRLAEHSQVSRDLDTLEEVSHVLINLPIDEVQRVGQYYQAIAIHRRGETEAARLLLESVADHAPMAYRARAIQSLGFVYFEQGQLTEEMYLQIEALKAAPNDANGLQTKLMAHFNISIVTSIFGDHKGALNRLECLVPMVQIVSKYNPFYYYLYHNALAVELGELGRVEEGQALLTVALNSPFADAHPEWHETRQELNAKQQKATSSQISLTCSPAIKTSRIKKQSQKKKVSISFQLRLSISRENLILFVTRTAIGQIHHRPSILDRLGEALQPRAPPARF